MGAILSLFIVWKTPDVQPGIHVASSPALITVKDSEQVTIQSFIESRCKSLVRGFRPAWWLFNGHLQTFYAAAGNFSNIDKIVYERQLLRVPDGGTLGLDFVQGLGQDELDPEAPIVVVLHGLTGGSYESYVRCVLSVACTSKEKGGLGYRGVVVNFRGCADVEITSVQFYSAGYTDDLRTALLYLSNLYPRAKLLGVGFSLGANVMTRYLGEEGKASKLVAACVLGCPWDLVSNSDQLEGHWFSRKVYSMAMGNNLRNLVKRNLSSVAELGPSILTPHLDTLLSTQKMGLLEVDEHLTRFVGGSSPPFPFPSARDYYTWASSHHYVNGIKIPFLAINAIDDPIVTKLPLPIPDEAGCVALVATQHGGHLGWFQRSKKSGRWAAERWIRQPVCEWLQAVGEELVVEVMQDEGGAKEIEGFMRDPINPKIGYQVAGEKKVVATSGPTGVRAGL